MPCHVMVSRAVPGLAVLCHAIFLRVMACHDHSVSFFLWRKGTSSFLKTCQTICPLSARSMLFFGLPLSSQPRLNLLSPQQQGRADYSMANRKITYTLGRGRAYILDMSSTSGNMGAKYFQGFGPRCSA